VGAEADVFGAVAVVEGGLDGPGIHSTVDCVQYDAPVGLEVGDSSVHQPSCAIAHLEYVHEDDGPHTCVPGLNGGLERIHPARAAENVGARVNMNIDGPSQELLRELEGTAIGQILCHEREYGFRSQIISA